MHLAVQPDSLDLALLAKPQICYALLGIHTNPTNDAGCTRHYALVIDASRSMRIPIVDEQAFRELVRAGGAREILVDGVPVWQLTQPIPAAIRARTPGALDYTARALRTVIERLGQADCLTLIACAEQSEVLIAGACGLDHARLMQGIDRLTRIHPGQTTDLAQGIALGLAELARQHPQAGQLTRHLILLTDGFTQNDETCMALARQAVDMGIQISAIGLGSQFQHDLLTTLADLTGGRAIFLSDASAIPQAIAQELEYDWSVSTQSISLSLRLSQHTHLRRATRLTPELTTLEPLRPTEREAILHLDGLSERNPTIILLEFLSPPVPSAVPPDSSPIRRVRLARLQISNETLPDSSYDLVATYTPTPADLSPVVLNAVARVTAAHLQQRAFAAIESGDLDTGITLLRAMAARLHDLSETNLAGIALREATMVAQTGQMSEIGASELRYGTRRLGQAITIQP